jgi:hypothetical protein
VYQTSPSLSIASHSPPPGLKEAVLHPNIQCTNSDAALWMWVLFSRKFSCPFPKQSSLLSRACFPGPLRQLVTSLARDAAWHWLCLSVPPWTVFFPLDFSLSASKSCSRLLVLCKQAPHSGAGSGGPSSRENSIIN